MNEQEKQTICIVDDDHANAQVLAFILGRSYETCMAHSGEAALELIAREQPDLVLLDIMMPDIDGLEVCEELKSNPGTARIPVVFITGLEDSGDQEKGFEVGAEDYIAKPISPRVVKARVRRILESSRYLQFLEGLVAQKGQSSEQMTASISGFLGR